MKIPERALRGEPGEARRERENAADRDKNAGSERCPDGVTKISVGLIK